MRERPDPDLLTALRNSRLLILVLVCAGAVLGFGVGRSLPRVYEAKASVMVGEFTGGDVSINDIKGAQSLAATYADIARRQPVLQPVTDELKLGIPWRRLADRVHVRIPREDPQVVDVTAEAESREQARAIAASVTAHLVEIVTTGATGTPDFLRTQLTNLQNEITRSSQRLAQLRERKVTGEAQQAQIDALITQIGDLQRTYVQFRALAPTSDSAAVRQLDEAQASAAPIRPDIRFDALLGALAGLLAGVVVAYLREARRRNRLAEAAPASGAVDAISTARALPPVSRPGSSQGGRR